MAIPANISSYRRFGVLSCNFARFGRCLRLAFASLSTAIQIRVYLTVVGFQVQKMRQSTSPGLFMSRSTDAGPQPSLEELVADFAIGRPADADERDLKGASSDGQPLAPLAITPPTPSAAGASNLRGFRWPSTPRGQWRIRYALVPQGCRSRREAGRGMRPSLANRQRVRRAAGLTRESPVWGKVCRPELGRGKGGSFYFLFNRNRPMLAIR